MRLLAALAVFVCVCVATPRIADACSPAREVPYELAPSADATPPGPVTVTAASASVHIKDPDAAPWACDSSIGTIRLEVQASDDVTPSDDLGYKLTIKDRPVDLYYPKTIANPLGGLENTVIIRFPHDAPSFAIDVGIRAVDRSGNVGPATVIPIEYTAPDGGCSTTRGAGWPLLLALALLVRRRQR